MKKNLLNGIDYMFFRIERVYFKREGEGTFTATMIISLFLMLSILCPFLVFARNFYGTSFLQSNSTLLSILVITLQLIFLIITYIRYRKVGKSLNLKWGNEKEPDKTNHGILIVIVLLSPLILLFLDIVL
jgi:uncharacterized membrane protein YidH (DUF202 family)